MTLDEKIVESVACAIFHAKPRNRIWDALPNEFKNQYRKQARAAITAFQAEAWQPIATHKTDAVKGPYSPHVLCAHAEKGWRRFGRYDLTLKRWYYSGTDEISQWSQIEGDEPTHWRDIPALPNPPASP